MEGIADKRFIEQLLESVFSQNIPSDNIIKTDGYTNLTATNKEQTFINEMLRTTDDGGINLVIFDADSNCERRRTELLDWKRRSKVDFELFLLPDNANSGELEDLLMQTINPVNQPAMERHFDASCQEDSNLCLSGSTVGSIQIGERNDKRGKKRLQERKSLEFKSSSII